MQPGKNGSEIFADGQLYVGVSRVKDLRNLYVDGDLSNIEHFASRAVLDYYEAIGITPDPAQDAGPEDADPEKAPAQTNKEKKHRPRNKGKDGG